MEGKQLQSAILKYRNLNDRKSAPAAADGGQAAAASAAKKRRPFTYTDHSDTIAQLLSGSTAASASSNNKLNSVYPTSTLLRSTAAAASYNASTMASTDGFQYEEAFQRGMKLVEKNDYKRALSEFTEAINVAPTKLKAYVQRAMCYMKAQRYEPAIDDYSTLIAHTPGDSDMFSKRAFAYECHNKIPSAIEDYTKAIEISGVPAKIKDARLARGKAYAKLGHLTHALEDFGSVIEMDPRSDDGYRQRGLVYTRLCKFDLALADYDRVVELEARQLTHVKLESLLQRAETLMKLVETEENGFLLHQMEDSALLSAENGHDRAVRHTPRTICLAMDETYLTPCESDDARSFALKAIDDFTAALDQEPESLDVLAARGEAYIRAGALTKALADFDAALLIDAKDHRLLLSRAVVLQLQDDAARPGHVSARALALLAQVTSSAPPLIASQGFFRRARLYLEHGQPQAAVDDLGKIVDLFPKVLNEERDSGADYLPDEQVKPHCLVGATSKESKSPVRIALQALLSRARVHMQLQSYALAAKDYQAILAVSPGHLDAQVEEQQARDLDEKHKVEESNRAVKWLLEHGDATEVTKKGARKKKKKTAKASTTTDRHRRPPAIRVKDAVTTDDDDDESGDNAARPATNDDDDDDDDMVPTPDASIPPPPVPQKISPTGSLGHRSSTPSSRMVMYTRDEACESLYETEAPAERVVPPRPTFHFSLTDDVPKDGDVTAKSSDDDETPMTTTTTKDDKSGASTPAASPVVLVDDKYLKKRRKQLEKLRADLVDVCQRRERDLIVDALDRATRKQMVDQLQDECQRARDVLEELKLHVEATPAQSPQRATPTTSSDASPVRLPSSSPPSRSPGKPPVSGVPPPIKTAGSPPRPIVSSPARPPRQAAESPDDMARLRYQIDMLQRALSEKQHEIDQLKRHAALVPPVSSPLPLSSLSSKLHGMERCMRPLAPAAFALPAMRHADHMVELFGPTVDSERVRTKLMRALASVLEPVVSVATFYPSGSYPLKTYLPDSDIDVCLVLSDDTASATWHADVTQALLAAATSDQKVECTVRNVTFVNAEVRVVKCTIDNVSIDVTANRFGALGAVSLLHEMDLRVGQHHLFKRSLILIKTWCMYDSSRFIASSSSSSSTGRSNILGAVAGALSTFALNTMVLCLFNLFGKRICHPLQALIEFFHFYADFDWTYHAVSMLGPVPIASLNAGWRPSVRSSDVVMDEVAVDAFKARIETVHGGIRPSLPFQVRACNVVDPLNECNNVARSVTADKLAEMKHALQHGRQTLVQIFYDAWHLASSAKKDDVHAEDIVAALDPRTLDSFFLNGWTTYGSGYRPDLLVHPRQVWHPPAMNPFGDGNVAIDVLASQVADLRQLP
ncbi:hypothetical protein SPRG_19699 [Saprolegnia parasitica CBS 223.65]|uniref:Polynucleotide adenylyltransferase n=1 Tax=Saprolegnia parasitica (strain CBS 223.65) TaxID=695850 RepID=A0A067CH48_SAPPC|nr:hypothetical protein SPRG_19699 [Saprolegnia parasitica CBS 223.65]KDO29813.1 hypothetical protein SPRG_19699 [Saprolegnia parasitica CBS 223.65]|eukprot:XP_012199522.1 hypothetical protein SPRG_19699 [Saprolegnia parasitica CBS 223.65]